MRFGLEEEVFVTEPTAPALDSLWYLSRLMWSNPRQYYTGTASNFARGQDARQGVMSGVEVTTRPHADITALMADLARQRQALARVTDGYLVAVGHLFDRVTPTNTCGLHLHLGDASDPLALYAKVARFLPLFAAATVSSPYAGNQPYGASVRMATSYALGPLREDPTYRFQDLIISKRLGTVEIRVFDPVWDLARLGELIRALAATLEQAPDRPLDRVRYNQLRRVVAEQGYGPELRELYEEVRGYYPVAEELFTEAPAVEARQWMQRAGLEATYAAFDGGYRSGRLQPLPRKRVPRSSAWRGAAGFLSYYVPKLPYIAWKAWREW